MSNFAKSQKKQQKSFVDSIVKNLIRLDINLSQHKSHQVENDNDFSISEL